MESNVLAIIIRAINTESNVLAVIIRAIYQSSSQML